MLEAVGNCAGRATRSEPHLEESLLHWRGQRRLLRRQGRGSLVGGREQAGRTLLEALAGRRRPKQSRSPSPPQGCLCSAVFRAQSYGTSRTLTHPPHRQSLRPPPGWAPQPHLLTQTPPQETSEVGSMGATHPETLRLGTPKTGLSSPSD